MKQVFIPFMERGEPRAFLPFTRLKLLFSLVAVLWAFTTTAQNITTVAGNGIAGYSGDNSVATSAQLYNPAGVAVDAAGNLYFADHENHRIRKVTAGGTITTVAGTGTEGYSGDDGPAINAQLNFPAGVAVDAAGNLYIADAYNHRIRKVSAGGTITTVAGTAARGYSGDDGPATSANLAYPYGVAVDASGNLYIADTGNHLIRKVSAGGTITMVAGNGGWGFDDDGGPATSAYLNYPYSVAVDASGNLYIADAYNHRIRKVSAGGTITTVAGTATQGYSGDDGPATSANLAYPFGVAVDASGNLYIADQVNHRIRKVSADGTITTVAGTGTEGYSGDDGPATSANLAYPFGVAIDAAGKLYIADFVNQRIRKVTFNTAPVATNDDYSVNRGQTLFIAAPGLLSNDTDAEGGQLTATLISDPSHGTLTLNPDGGFSYTHNGSATSSDSFTYQASNGAVSSYTATVNIMVIPTTTVASIKVLDSNPTNANSLRYAVTFADPVSGVDITDFSLATTGTAAGTIASVSGSGTTYEVQVNNVSGAGDLRLDFTSMTGVTPNAASGYTSGEKYMVDTIRPTIASASAPDNTIYKIGDVMEITVNFNNAILVNNTNGIPTLTLETGAVDALASYVSGSGSSALRFKYTVQEGNYNMIGLSLNAFALNGGILTDAYGNAADLTVSGVPFTDNVLVDGVRPTLQTVTITSTNNDASKAKVGDVIIFEFKASEQISLASVSIPGRTAVATKTVDVWRMVTFTLTAEDAEGAVSFSINYQDMQGNPGIAVSSTTDGSSVVFDRTAPVVLTKDITVELDATGTTTITAAQINNGSTDNYSIPANGYSLDKSTFTCENVGPNTVTLTVTDATGNSESTTAIVTVKDVTAPLAKARNITIQLDANGTTVVTPAMIDNGSSDICGTITLVLSKTAFDCSNLGANMVTLTATDQAGNVSTATATITIEDKVAPKAIAKNITVSLDATGNATINAADVSNASSDNCGIETPVLSKTAFDCSNVGENSVTLTVTDKSGNTHEATAIVTIVDETLPVAIAKNITVQLDATGNATITADEIDNGSSDACGIKTMTLSKTSFDCANVGDNTITLTVTDNNGNVATATAIVKVEDNIIPIAKAQNVTIELDDNGVATITSAAVDNGSTDACGAVTLDLSKTTFGCANLGANTVTLTVADGSGNKSTTTATVTVEDKIAPVAKTQNVTVQLDATGNATITPAQVNNGSSDNCDVASVSLDRTAFTCGNVGDNTVTLTVTDNSSNVSTATATVTVLKAAQTISFAALDDATYGETPVTLNATSTSGEAVAYTVEGPATLAGNVLTITGAGQVRVTATQSGNGCFEAAAEVARAFQVAKKQLIVTADKKARVYGEQNPAFTYTLTGFAGTEDGTVLDVLPQATTAATAESNAGEYAITVSGGSDDNYSFAYQAAKLTIQKATATVELTNLEQPEDGQSKQVTINTSPAGLAVRVTYDGSETPPTARGTYEVVASVEDINYQGTATAMLKVLTPTGVAELTNEPKDILLYPNPTRDGRVFLELERAKAGSSMLVEIFTASGRQLSSQRVTGPGRHELDLSKYATGLYMVCITDGQAVRTVKVHKL